MYALRDLEYEVEGLENPGIRFFRFHLFCYAIWIEECARHKGLDSHA